MLAFAENVVRADATTLAGARGRLAEVAGAGAVVAAALTVAGFSLVDRAANGVGIWVEPMVLKPSEVFRALLGINDFPSARNTLSRHS